MFLVDSINSASSRFSRFPSAHFNILLLEFKFLSFHFRFWKSLRQQCIEFRLLCQKWIDSGHLLYHWQLKKDLEEKYQRAFHFERVCLESDKFKYISLKKQRISQFGRLQIRSSLCPAQNKQRSWKQRRLLAFHFGNQLKFPNKEWVVTSSMSENRWTTTRFLFCHTGIRWPLSSLEMVGFFRRKFSQVIDACCYLFLLFTLEVESVLLLPK